MIYLRTNCPNSSPPSRLGGLEVLGQGTTQRFLATWSDFYRYTVWH